MKIRKSLVAASLVLAYTGSALGAVSAEEAKKLGKTLTAVGAEMAGNADGSIPAYTGGLTTPPANFKEGSGVRPDPFASEKPLYSITAANMGKYADKLTEGNKALLKKYPSYRIDVYKTHRTVAFPKYVLDNTAHNAVNTKTTNGGLQVSGAKGGYPFPIPKDGYEAMWNHLLKYNGEAIIEKYSSWNIDSAGRKSLSTSGIISEEWPFYNKKNPDPNIFFSLKVEYKAPARRNGEVILIQDPLDIMGKGRKAWQYLPGQRRVKMAPEIAFDTPNPAAAGATTYDDTFQFNGSMERYNFKLVGKREMIVPYNAYKMLYQTKSDILCGPNHLNPDHLRWELHRVWVVEATLKPGKRHIYSKRTFLLDEDSWAVVVSDQYDARGQLFRTKFTPLTYSYDVNAVHADGTVSYDLIANTYNTTIFYGDEGSAKYTAPFPKTYMTPDSLSGSGIR